MNGDGSLRTTFLSLEHHPGRFRNSREKRSQCCPKAKTPITGRLQTPEQCIQMDRSSYTKDRAAFSQTHSDRPREVQSKQQKSTFPKGHTSHISSIC